MASYDWKITHSYSTDELKFENELSIMRTFKFRLYDGAGTYIEAGYQRDGTDLDAMQDTRTILFLPNIILMFRDGVIVGGTEYTDMHISLVWKKGLGLKSRAVGDGVTVGIQITSNATISEETAGVLYKAGNLYIKVLSGTASLAANTLTISGSDVLISVGINSSFDPESNYFGIANENMNLTSIAPSKGLKIVEQSSGETVYFRWDDLTKLYELSDMIGWGAAWYVTSNTGRKLLLIPVSYTHLTLPTICSV